MRFLFLDSSPLGLLTYPVGSRGLEEGRLTRQAHAINEWLARGVRSGIEVIVPAVVYYEMKRELLRANKARSIERLDAFVGAGPGLYLPSPTKPSISRPNYGPGPAKPDAPPPRRTPSTSTSFWPLRRLPFTPTPTAS